MAFVLTLSELARWVDGVILRGDPDLPVTGLAALDLAGPGEVSFLGNEKYRAQFLQTRAAAVLVAKDETGGPQGVALIAVENPTLAFSVVIAHFREAANQITPGIHPQAAVDPSAVLDASKVQVHAGAVIMAGAMIGDGSQIGPNAVIGPYAVIGRDCHVMANVTLRERCVLGDRVVLQPGAVIGADGFGYELVDGRHVKIPQVGIVEIADDVEVGANTTIDRARFGKTFVGEGTKIDNLVQIGHNVVLGNHCLIVALCGISGSTRLGNYVTMAGQAGTVGHITIGDHATLTGRCGVTTHLAGGQVYSGRPAQPFKEEMKLRAHVRRLPKLVDRVKAIEQALENR